MAMYHGYLNPGSNLKNNMVCLCNHIFKLLCLHVIGCRPFSSHVYIIFPCTHVLFLLCVSHVPLFPILVVFLEILSSFCAYNMHASPTRAIVGTQICSCPFFLSPFHFCTLTKIPRIIVNLKKLLGMGFSCING